MWGVALSILRRVSLCTYMNFVCSQALDPTMDDFGAQLSARARAVSDAVYEKTLDVRNNALLKAGVQPQDLS